MTNRFATLLAAATFAGVASVGEAATVTSVSGEMLVNQGAGYRPMSGEGKLNAGSLVMVGAQGSARITYDDGCVVQVAPGRVELVGAQSPCSAGAPNAMTTGATPPPPLPPPPVPAAGVAGLSSTYVLAGVGIAAGVGGIVAVSNSQRAEQRQRNAASP